VEGPVKSKLDGLEYCFNVAVTAAGVFFRDIDDLTAAVTCALVATRLDGDAATVTTEKRREAAVIAHATYTLVVFIRDISMPLGPPGR
jgi:hypothetical protein